MRNATAGLRRQAMFAALACALLASVLATLSGARLRTHADTAFDPPILVKSVAVDRTRVVNEAKAPDLPIVPASVQAPASTKAQNPLVHKLCGVSPCHHLAALPPAPPRRPAASSEGATVEVALTTVAPETDKHPRSLSDRLLWPVGSLRDRVAGLISSL
ncbi:hypothetical protein [Methylocapsa sp. S129]|uniref:hypothetical protein n=1 Tax=Methylocapsa sp. S129 TaxID=1641869 RepID=UPI00131CF58D|nr:hypothetical protein [Methylocapsa sp. S129]